MKQPVVEGTIDQDVLEQLARDCTRAPRSSCYRDKCGDKGTLQGCQKNQEGVGLESSASTQKGSSLGVAHIQG